MLKYQVRRPGWLMSSWTFLTCHGFRYLSSPAPGQLLLCQCKQHHSTFCPVTMTPVITKCLVITKCQRLVFTHLKVYLPPPLDPRLPIALTGFHIHGTLFCHYSPTLNQHVHWLVCNIVIIIQANHKALSDITNSSPPVFSSGVPQ